MKLLIPVFLFTFVWSANLIKPSTSSGGGGDLTPATNYANQVTNGLTNAITNNTRMILDESNRITSTSNGLNMQVTNLSNLNRTLFIPANWNGDYGNYAVQSVAGGATANISGYVPLSVSAIQSINIHYFIGGNTSTNNWSFYTSYGSNGQSMTNYAESVFNVSIVSRGPESNNIVNIYKADSGQTIFTNLTSGMAFGLKTQAPGGVTIYYQGVSLVWKAK